MYCSTVPETLPNKSRDVVVGELGRDRGREVRAGLRLRGEERVVVDRLAVGEAVEEEEEGVERQGAAVERDKLWGIVVDDDGSEIQIHPKLTCLSQIREPLETMNTSTNHVPKRDSAAYCGDRVVSELRRGRPRATDERYREQEQRQPGAHQEACGGDVIRI